MKQKMYYVVTASFTTKRRHLFLSLHKDSCCAMVTLDMPSAKGFILKEIAKKLQAHTDDPIEVFMRLKLMDLRIHKIPIEKFPDIGILLDHLIDDGTTPLSINNERKGKILSFVVGEHHEKFLDQFEYYDYTKNIIEEIFYE